MIRLLIFLLVLQFITNRQFAQVCPAWMEFSVCSLKCRWPDEKDKTIFTEPNPASEFVDLKVKIETSSVDKAYLFVLKDGVLIQNGFASAGVPRYWFAFNASTSSSNPSGRELTIDIVQYGFGTYDFIFSSNPFSSSQQFWAAVQNPTGNDCIKPFGSIPAGLDGNHLFFVYSSKSFKTPSFAQGCVAGYIAWKK